MLHAVDLGEELLEPRRDLALDLLDREPRRRHVHVGQGHDDLRLFLAWSDGDGQQPGGQGDRDYQARQVAAQEEIDDATQQGAVGCVRRGTGHRSSGEASPGSLVKWNAMGSTGSRAYPAQPGERC